MANGTPSDTYLDQVLDALPYGGPGATPRSIFAAIGVGAPRSVPAALTELRHRGLCLAAGDGRQRRYWRALKDGVV